jgi:hypothetical protein
MQAERVWLETDAHGHLVSPAALPPSSRIEAILLIEDSAGAGHVRKPPPELAKMTRILGDLVEPAVPPEDWDALRNYPVMGGV